MKMAFKLVDSIWLTESSRCRNKIVIILSHLSLFCYIRRYAITSSVFLLHILLFLYIVRSRVFSFLLFRLISLILLKANKPRIHFISTKRTLRLNTHANTRQEIATSCHNQPHSSHNLYHLLLLLSPFLLCRKGDENKMYI